MISKQTHLLPPQNLNNKEKARIKQTNNSLMKVLMMYKVPCLLMETEPNLLRDMKHNLHGYVEMYVFH